MRFLITAGPTQEPIDPVRYISNRSSGQMGYAIAEAALEAGHRVVLISGRVNLAPPSNARSDPGSDQRPDVRRGPPTPRRLRRPGHVRGGGRLQTGRRSRDQNQEEATEPFSLELVPTRDILASLPQPRNFLVVGFAAETNDLEKNARKKLREKQCDLIVANDVSRIDMGMESADNEVTIFFRDDKTAKISRAPKKTIARELIKIISNMKKNV